MATDCIAQLTFEGERFPKPVVAAFDQAHASSDGGLLLVQAVDARLGLTVALADCLHDGRQPGKVQHPVVDLVRQRVFGLVLGYADGNDAARLAADPLHKLALGRDPLTGPALSSQPTLSRFENAVTRPALGRLLHRIADRVIASHRHRWAVAASAASPSTWTRPTTPPTASRPSPSSAATTRPGTICRCSRR